MKSLFRHALIVTGYVMIAFAVLTQKCSATHRVEYTWASQHVSLTYEDVVGTPVPPSYGFRANIQDLGHKKRILEEFMRTPAGQNLGDRLTVHVSMYGIGDQPSGMEVSTSGSRAFITRPLSDGRLIYALLEMSEGSRDFVVDSLSPDQALAAKQVLSRLIDDGFPVFSPSGERLAFQSWRGGVLDVYVYDFSRNRLICLGGSKETRKPLADTSGILGLPQWSPDEKKIAYIADGRLVVSDIGRGLTRVLTAEDKTIIDISWSPDSQRIAAVVSAPEDDTRYAQDILIVDPTGERPAVSVGGKLPIFSRGYFPVRLSWSADSENLAVGVNLAGVDLGTGGRYLTEEEMRTSVLYIVDFGSSGVRNMVLPGHLVGGVWDDTSESWFGALSSGDQASIIHVRTDTLTIRTLAVTNAQVAILCATGGRVTYVDGEKLMEADTEKVVPHPVTGAIVQRFELQPGIYGGYSGGSEDLSIPPESGENIIVVETSSLPTRTVNGGFTRVFVTEPDCFPSGWLARFARQYDVLHMDWCPRKRLLVGSASPDGGLIRILSAEPGSEPNNLSEGLDRLPVRSLMLETAGRRAK